MLWYFFDYDSWSKHRKSKPDLKFSSPSSGTRNNDNELEKKLKVAEENQRDLEEKLKAAEDKQQDLETKVKDSADREKELEEREQTLAEKEAQMKDGKDEDSQEAIKKLERQMEGLKSDINQARRENDKLKANEAELSRLQQAYEELKRYQAGDNSRATTSPLSDANSQRTPDGVGLRDTPLGLRTREPRPNTTKGRLPQIQLQQSFSRLPRLRS